MENTNRLKRIVLKFFINVLLVFTVLITVFPLLWVLVSSFKTNGEILSSPFALPQTISFVQYKYLFENYNFIRYFFNSLIVSLLATFIGLVIFSMAAYIFAKFEFKFKNLLFSLFVITLLVPVHSKAQPIFSLIMSLNLYDSLTGLTLVYISSGMAMSLFILRSEFENIPDSLTESALIDGASFWQIFSKVNLPLAKNGLTTAGTLMFLNNWNEYFYASLLTSSDSKRTLTLALEFFNESFSYDYTKLFAALVLVILPGVLLYTISQETIQNSIASTGIK